MRTCSRERFGYPDIWHPFRKTDRDRIIRAWASAWTEPIYNFWKTIGEACHDMVVVARCYGDSQDFSNVNFEYWPWPLDKF